MFIICFCGTFLDCCIGNLKHRQHNGIHCNIFKAFWSYYFRLFYIKLSLEFCVSLLCYMYFFKIIFVQSIVVISREGWDGLKDYLMYITSTELFRFSRWDMIWLAYSSNPKSLCRVNPQFILIYFTVEIEADIQPEKLQPAWKLLFQFHLLRSWKPFWNHKNFYKPNFTFRSLMFLKVRIVILVYCYPSEEFCKAIC